MKDNKMTGIASGMVISTEIIEEEINAVERHYHELLKLFENNFQKIQGYFQIKTTINDLLLIPPSRSNAVYPDLKSGYPDLKKFTDKTIYMFSVENFPYDESEMKKIVEGAKEKGVSLPKRNKSSEHWKNVKKEEEVCLYVGSSEEIVARLKEHLFEYNATNYAMHLKNWLGDNVQFTIRLWDFSDFLIDEDTDKNFEYLQNIEDLLWQHYQPLLGRQGKK